MTNSYSDSKFQAEVRFKVMFVKGGASVSTSESSNKTQTDEYSSSIKTTKAQTIGGLYKPGLTVDEWAKTLDKNLAIIDKEIDSIDSFITNFNFPNIQRISLAKTREMVENATEAYLRTNLLKDCQDRKSIKYQPFSNSHDPDACIEDYIFGAFYEIKNECANNCSITQPSYVKNYLTQEMECPDGFEPKKHTFNKPNKELYDFFECIGDPSFEKSPILFGGVYTAQAEDNPVTNAKTCPKYFDVVAFAQNKAFICLSRDFKRGLENAIPFLGFLSTCNIHDGSKLKCEKSYYEKRFVASINGCYLYYCTRVKKGERVNLKKPPYVPMPQNNRKPIYNIIMEREEFITLKKNEIRSYKTSLRDVTSPFIQIVVVETRGKVNFFYSFDEKKPFTDDNQTGLRKVLEFNDQSKAITNHYLIPNEGKDEIFFTIQSLDDSEVLIKVNPKDIKN